MVNNVDQCFAKPKVTHNPKTYSLMSQRSRETRNIPILKRQNQTIL